MLIDLHVHSTISGCSSLPLEDILSTARSRGLDGVCITDHDSTDVLAQIEEGFQSDGLLVLVGMEYGTPQGDFLVFGHVEVLPKGMQASELLPAVKQLGGAAIAAHPFRGWRPTDTSLFETEWCSAIEIENGRNTEFENDLAAGLARKHMLPGVAGSDAHNLTELGRYPTRFSVPIQGREDLVHALNMGQCEPASANPKPVSHRKPISVGSGTTLPSAPLQHPWQF